MKITRFIATLIGKSRCLLDSHSEQRHSLVGAAELWKQKRDFQISFLTKMGLRSGDYLLDVGCGTLRGGIPLIRYLQPGHYFGVDVREKVLVEARKEVRKERLEYKRPTLVLTDDLSTIDWPRRFSFIWAFSVLVHMQDSVLETCMEMVARNLACDGQFFANVVYGDREDGAWQGFPVVYRSFEFYREVASKFGLSSSDIGALSEFGHHTGLDWQDQQRMLEMSWNRR